MKAAYLKVYRELLKKRHVPRKIKAAHLDIEDAIAERGGERGSLNHA